uniref:PKS01 highly reducing polyketide synthase n=1 Tax=Floropilus chiversii TaxID=2587399 RepID=C5H891_FLOCH|nr:PKS01 highly reducing polyketide synthase [Floropilus chiversii]
MVQSKGDAASVAITGLACRMPGDGSSLESFWESICNGKSAWSPIPRDRFDPDAFTGNAAKGGHFLREDISRFDAKFFNISHDEACAMDPQQRLMLEVVYEALEAAGYPLNDVAGTKTGVYMGQFTDDYRELVTRDAETSLPYSMTGLQRASLSNRVSWLLDLRGPSFTVATACSSSLVALHLACQSLRNKEIDMAIVGGCNLMLSPNMFIFQSGQGFLSPDGKCKTFDASADGYGRGEGFAVVVLRRVNDAVNHGDPIRAVIRGSGSNQDGHTKGFTLPSADAQASLIRDVYNSAGLDYSLTGYVEAHGTGTKAGDLEETTALASTIASGLRTGKRLVVGSVKTNVGHLEAGAGLAAVIKSVLILEHAVIPPNINLESPNPALKLEEWNMEVPLAASPWPTDGLRRISINSFGYGGSNAHVILDDAYSYLAERGLHGVHSTAVSHGTNGLNGLNGRGTASGDPASHPASSRPLLFALSAQDKGGIARVMSSLKNWLVAAEQSRQTTKTIKLRSETQDYLHDLAFTLNTRRSHLQWKTFCIASTIDELLSALASPTPIPPRLSSRPPRLAFIFTGQGAQWPGMGTTLSSGHRVFSASIEAADTYLRTRLGCAWSAVEELGKSKSASRIHTAALAQPLCTVLQVALVDLLRSWGVQPAAVAGHSSGEIAAAYCAGALSREQAWAVAYFRGVSAARVRATGRDGAMMAVGASPAEVAGLIRESGLSKSVCVACENAPASVTVSGDADAVDKLGVVLQEKGIFARRLRVDMAYHSPHMQAVAKEYLASVSGVFQTAAGDGKKSQARLGCVMYSSVTGNKVGDPSELSAAYWVRNLISPVRFSTAAQHLAGGTAVEGEEAADVFVEIGPHTALQGPTTQSLQAVGVGNVPYHSVLRRDEDGRETALALAGTLFTRGYPVDISAVNNQSPRTPQTLVGLPSYPWDHSRGHWAESRIAREYRLRKPLPNSSLLGAAAPALVAGERVWRGHISLAKYPWIADHMIHGKVLFPAAGFIAMVVEAALFNADAGRQVDKFRLRDIHLTAPLVVSDNSVTEYSVCLRPRLSASNAASPEDWMEFSISSSPDGKTLERNCIGLITLEYRSQLDHPNEGSTEAVDTHQQAWKRRFQQVSELCKTPVAIEDFYRRMASAGLQYGPVFKNLARAWTAPGQSVGSVGIPDGGLLSGRSQTALVIHPATLDAVIHMAFAAVCHGSLNAMQAMVPKSIDEVVISTEFPKEPKAHISGYATAARQGYREILADMTMQEDVSEQPVLKIAGLCCVELAGAPTDGGTGARSICSQLVWRPSAKLLTLGELGTVVRRGATTVGAGGGAPAESVTGKLLFELINVLHHSKPAASVVEVVTAKGEDAPRPFVSTLDIGGALKTASYNIYVPDEATKREVEAQLALDTDSVGIEVHDLTQALVGNKEDQPPTSDLVIIRDESGLGDMIVEKAAKLVASDGGLVFIVAPRDQGDDLEARGRAAGVRDWLRLDDHEEQFAVLLGQRRSQEKALNGVGGSTQVVVLESSNPSPAASRLAAALVARLSDLGYSASACPWGVHGTASFEGKTCISLVEIDRGIMGHLSEDDFNLFKGLVFDAKKVLWITVSPETDPSTAIVTGLARALRSEEPGIVFNTMSLDLAVLVEEPSFDLEHMADMILRAYKDGAGENEFRISQGLIETSRVVEDDELNGHLLASLGMRNAETTSAVQQLPLEEAGSPLKLCVRNPGLLDSLCFKPDELAGTTLAEDEVEVEVKVTSLNFRDVMTAMGQLPSTELGFDAAGVVRRIGGAVTKVRPGDRVAMCTPGAHRTIHRAKADLVEVIPEGMTFVEAATIPLVHGTAWYALVRLARVRKGQSVLIHVATGGVGQAALQIAQHVGMEIFATAGTEQKRQLLRDVYGIPDDHIFSSRDLSFAQGIKRITRGRGVDVVLNSLPGEALRQTWYCVAPFGTFVEIGVRDILDNSSLDMRPFLKETTFTFFDLKKVMQQRPDLMGEIMRGVFDLQRQGITRPINPVAAFPASEIENAFRLMQGGQHVGKIVVSFEDGQQLVPVWRPRASSRAPLRLNPNSAYVLAGGLGGLGRSLASMLVEHGARKLCFLSRSGGAKERPKARDLIHQLQDRGVQVLALTCDVADGAAVEHAVRQCEEQLGRVAGIIQCAMVLRDSLFRNATYADWIDSTRPKVHGTWNLHAALPDVDFFVNLASFTGIFGSRGVASYAAGSTYQDAIAHLRRAEGKHGVTLDLSVVRDAGVLAEAGMTQGLKDLAGPYGLDMEEVAELVWLAISGDVAGDSSAQIITGIATGGSAVEGGFEAPWYLDDPKFAVMAQTGFRGSRGAAATQRAEDVQAQLSHAKTLDEAARVVTEALVDRVAKMLQTTAAEIDTDRYLHSYGIDSLVAIETVNWALKVCAARVTVFDIMAAVPMTATARKIAANSSATPKEALQAAE